MKEKLSIGSVKPRGSIKQSVISEGLRMSTAEAELEDSKASKPGILGNMEI